MLTSGRKHQNLHISSLMYVESKKIKIHVIGKRDLKKIGGQNGVPKFDFFFCSQNSKIVFA